MLYYLSRGYSLPIGTGYTFDPSLYELSRTDAGAQATIVRRAGLAYTTATGTELTLQDVTDVYYADYEAVVAQKWTPMEECMITILHRYVPLDTFFADAEKSAPGLLQYLLFVMYPNLFKISAVHRLDRVNSRAAFSLAIVWRNPTGYIDVVSSRADKSMYVSARYELPGDLDLFSHSANANIVRFEMPITINGSFRIALLDIETGSLTLHEWNGVFQTMRQAQERMRPARADRKHLPDVPPSNTDVFTLMNMIERERSGGGGDRKRKGGDDMTVPPTAVLRNKSKLAM
jgi:hypothetical protein